MLTEWLLVGLGVLLTAGTAVFVAAEFALVTLDPGLVDRDLAGQQDIRTRSVRKALRQLSTQLSGAQVGITVTTILLGYTAQPALATLLTGPLDSTPLARGAATGLAAVNPLCSGAASTDPAVEQQCQRAVAPDRRRAAGGALRGAFGTGAGRPRAALGGGRHPGRGHRDPVDELDRARHAHRRRRHDGPDPDGRGAP